MDQLPEDILIEIFQYLDNESMLNVLKSCSFFTHVFATSSKLLLKFNLQISPQSINQLSTLSDMPFKNITVSNVESDDDFGEVKKFMKKFTDYVEILNLQNILITNFENFQKLLMDFNSIEQLKFNECTTNDTKGEPLPLIASLRSLTFEDCCPNIFKLFTQQETVKIVKFYKNKISSDRYIFDDFNLMTAAMPNLNDLTINGFCAPSFFNLEKFPFEVEKFETTLLTNWWYVSEPRLRFLKSQQGTLKELTIHRLPYDDDGSEVLKFIIEEMKLEKFYLRKNPLILNGKKQDVRKLTVNEFEMFSMYEMFRQYPIQYLTLMLTHTHIDGPVLNQFLNPSTNFFENLQSLEVVDQSRQHFNFPRFLGLYKNCRNIKKLSIITNNDNINFVLWQCLPEMSKLIEINLNVDLKDNNLVNEMFAKVKRYVRNLKKLGIVEKFVDDARRFFPKNVQIVEIL